MDNNIYILRYALQRIASGDTKKSPRRIAMNALVDYGNAEYMEKEETMKRFWMVVRDEQNSMTHQRHETIEGAMTEAERLCRKERKGFFILTATHAVALETPQPPVKWTAWAKEEE